MVDFKFAPVLLLLKLNTFSYVNSHVYLFFCELLIHLRLFFWKTCWSFSQSLVTAIPLGKSALYLIFTPLPPSLFVFLLCLGGFCHAEIPYYCVVKCINLFFCGSGFSGIFRKVFFTLRVRHCVKHLGRYKDERQNVVQCGRQACFKIREWRMVCRGRGWG